MTAAALALFAAPALSHAQTVTGYGSVGVTRDDAGPDITAIQGRLGARIGPYVGVEGEVSAGVDSDTSGATKSKLRDQKAIYGVGFYPLTPKVDVLARVGYGDSTIRNKTDNVVTTDDRTSWNYGVGAQYALSPKNGVRVDYTERDYIHAGRNGHSWGIAYVRKF